MAVTAFLGIPRLEGPYPASPSNCESHALIRMATSGQTGLTMMPCPSPLEQDERRTERFGKHAHLRRDQSVGTRGDHQRGRVNVAGIHIAQPARRFQDGAG